MAISSCKLFEKHGQKMHHCWKLEIFVYKCSFTNHFISWQLLHIFFQKTFYTIHTSHIFFHYHCAKKFPKKYTCPMWKLHVLCCVKLASNMLYAWNTYILRFLTYPMYEIFDFLLCDDGNEWLWQRLKMWMYKFMSYFLKFCDPLYINWLSTLNFFPIVPQCKNIENLMHLNQH